MTSSCNDATPEPAAGLPPRPPLQSPASRSELVRYGVTWDGSSDKPLLTPIPDGYWTPWHIAAQSPGPEPAADGPAVPDSREPASVVNEPTDAELLELMPETMRDEFSYAATVCSEASGGQVKPGIFRVTLNTSALDYARAVLARYGNQPPQPIPLAERLPRPDAMPLPEVEP